MTGILDLLKRRQPTRLTDIFGQPTAVTWATSQIRAGTYKHGLFEGPSGVGKSAMAVLYGRAMLCESKDIRPCGTCEACAEFQRDDHHPALRIVDCTKLRKDERTFQATLELIERGEPFYRHCAVFLDEGQVLNKYQFSLLLKLLERKERRGTVILATTDLKRIPGATRDRFDLVPFFRISDDDLVDIGCRTCREERIPFDPDAIEVLAIQANGSYRSLLMLIEKFFNTYGAVNLENIKAFGGAEHEPLAIATATALINADYASAHRIAQTWKLAPAQKADALQTLLLDVFTTEVRRRRIERPQKYLGQAAPIRDLVARAAEKANTRQMDLEQFWRDVVKFWDPSPAETETSLLARAERFADLMS